MGTNFYMMTTDKEAAIEWFCDDYTLTDFPAGMIFEDNEKKIVEWLKRFYCLKV